jgi:acetyl esterase/lipase
MMKYLITALIFLQSFSIVNALDVKGFKPDAIVEYKKTEKKPLSLHFFYPADYKKENSEKYPAIVFFFGGGWNSGSPSQFYPFCKHLADQGVVAISAEYRTAKSHGTTPKECVMDAKSAVRWIRKNAKEYNINPDRIAAGGGSAGGHIAAATGTATSFEEESEDKSISSRPNLLVLFNPVVDNGPGGYGHSRVKGYFKEISPLHNITKETPNSIFFLGSKDNLIPVKTGEDWDKKIKAVGKKSELHIWDGQGHSFFNYKNKAIYDEIIVKMDAFLKAEEYIK